jgi:hypothetical protein
MQICSTRSKKETEKAFIKMEKAAKGHGLRKNDDKKIPNNETGNNNRWTIKQIQDRNKNLQL